MYIYSYLYLFIYPSRPREPALRDGRKKKRTMRPPGRMKQERTMRVYLKRYVNGPFSGFKPNFKIQNLE